MKIIFGSGKHHYLARLSAFLIIAALIAGMVGCVGNGSQNLEIRDWYDLDDVRDNLAGHHTLMNDLDSTTPGYTALASPTANGGNGWQPIGNFADFFVGTFDGQGYEMRDLFINRPDEWLVGLFFGVGQDGVIKDMGIGTNIISIGNSDTVGGLTALNLGTVSNSYATGSVTGVGYVGGLVGFNDGTVSNSYSTGSVTGDYAIGGLVGINMGTVNNSYATGGVTGIDTVGGLVGKNDDGTVSNSCFTGSVTGTDGVGGLVGYNLRGTVSDSYSTGSVNGENYVGGLVGIIREGTVSNSYYNYDEALINGDSIITIGALFSEDFDQWLANDKFLDVNEKLSQESDYYLINNISDFKQLLAFGQNGTLKFRLTSDLDLGDEPNFYIPYLAGEFDGNGHKISNLSCNFDFVSPVGLFGYLASGGNVAEVGVENVNITGANSAGGLVGYNWDGTVSNSHSIGSVTGSSDVGGLVGENREGTVSNSYSTANVTGYTSCVGGLVGANRDSIVSNSYSTGSVTSIYHVGGLVGDNGGTVSNSYSTGSVTGNSSVGGLVGSSYGAVSNSFWDTETSGQSASDGGTGKNTTEMQNIATFSGAGWDIIAVADPGTRNPSYIWNIVDDETYPFLSWQP